MRIGFLSVFNYGAAVGGVENHIYFLARELVRCGHEVVVFQPCDEDGRTGVEVVEDGAVTVVKIHLRPFAILSVSNRINGLGLIGFATAFINKARFILSRAEVADVVSCYNCDIVHQHDFISSLFATKILSKIGSKCVLTNHTGEYLFLRRSSVARRLIRPALRHFGAVIGPSSELTPIDFHSRATTIYNGVDPDIFFEGTSADRMDLRKRLGLNADDFLVLCPRRWAPTKGVIYLADSIADGGYDAKIVFLFAGHANYGGTSYAHYAQKVLGGLRRGREDRIRLLGNLTPTDLAGVYRGVDLVVIPSLMEAVSLAAIEAMACGAVVVSTNVGGMPELIDNEINGLLIKPRSAVEIRKAVNRLFQNRILLGDLRENGRETARRFLWSEIARKTLDVYRDLV